MTKWNWFYPQHFSPFASDFEDLASLDIKFDLAKPFRPYDQLMSVFPADSRQHIPSPLHHLMLDSDSPIIDFYPSEFHIDMNGKKMLWQGVALLPFIDETRLLEAIEPNLPKLSEEEKRRNAPGQDVIFVQEGHPLYLQIAGLYQGRPSTEVGWHVTVVNSADALLQPLSVDWKRSNRILGSIARDPECVPGSTYFCPLSISGEADIDNDKSLAAHFFIPTQQTPHRSVLLQGARPQRGSLTSHDVELVKRGGVPDSRPQGNGYHSTRRDIDGIGVRQASDRPYRPHDRSYSNNHQHNASNNQNPYTYKPPVPSYSPPNQAYNQAPSYQAPQYQPSYTPPSAPVYYPPATNQYSNYGQQQYPPQQAPVYQPPANTFNNYQAMRLPAHLQQQPQNQFTGAQPQGQQPTAFGQSTYKGPSGYVYKR